MRVREILFRGQTREYGEKVDAGGKPLPGEWVYGGIYMSPDRKHAIIYNEDGKFPVHSDTVGQYTGLCDKNGVKVFEDDLLMIDNGWRKPKRVMWIPDRFGFYVCTEGGSGEPLFPQISEYGEVVGNIFDTPENWKIKHDKISKIGWHEVFSAYDYAEKPLFWKPRIVRGYVCPYCGASAGTICPGPYCAYCGEAVDMPPEEDNGN